MAKYYAVKVGMVPGIYTSWDECRAQVNGYPGAVYKSFLTEQSALDFMGTSKPKNDKKYKMDLVAYTDGSFDGDSVGWGFILLHGDTTLIQSFGPGTKDIALRNIGGEIEAAEEAIRKAVAFGADHITLYLDYEGVGRWGEAEWNSNKPDTIAYRDFVEKMREKLDIDFVKVKGHTGNRFNDIADQLANSGRCAEGICNFNADGEILSPEDEEFLIDEQKFLSEHSSKTSA